MLQFFAAKVGNTDDEQFCLLETEGQENSKKVTYVLSSDEITKY